MSIFSTKIVVTVILIDINFLWVECSIRCPTAASWTVIKLKCYCFRIATLAFLGHLTLIHSGGWTWIF